MGDIALESRSYMKRLLFGFLMASVLRALPQTSVLIEHASIAEGTGKALYIADVRLTGDRIAEIGNLRAKQDDKVIEGRGLILAPGFTDMHNHSTDPSQDLDAESQISQGITTLLVGQDGGSPLSISAYLSKREQQPAAFNVQTLVGHASVREKVMGTDFKRKATPAEVQQMATLVEQSMREGAVGLSTGLEYEVGSYSSTAEVIELAKAASRYHGIYVSHIRDEGDQVFNSLREAIQIGEQAHIPVEISHIKLASAKVWGKADEAIALIDAAHRRRLDVTADCYPYDAWASTIKVLVLDKQYDNPASVAKGLSDVGGAENVTIVSCDKHPKYKDRNLSEISQAEGVSPVALYSSIVRDGGAGIVCRAMKPYDMRRFYQQPWVMVGSDGGIGMRHPRAAGTFPRVLGVYLQEQHWLTLPDAIRKMTSAPAHRLRLVDRGEIRKGAFADLVLFDPKTVHDRATFANPLALSAGIQRVFVNGELVWDLGKTTGKHPGRVLKSKDLSK